MFSIIPILGVFLLALQACNDGKQGQSHSELHKTDTIRYGNNGYVFPKLVPKADAVVKDWPIYKDFNGVSSDLGNSNLEQLKQKGLSLFSITDSLSRSLPDVLQNNMIISRIAVVKTRVNLLNQEVQKGKIDSLQIENCIKELQKATSNFVQQINEKIQKDQIDSARRQDEIQELEKKERARDSIFQLELEDQSP